MTIWSPSGFLLEKSPFIGYICKILIGAGKRLIPPHPNPLPRRGIVNLVGSAHPTSPPAGERG